MEALSNMTNLTVGNMSSCVTEEVYYVAVRSAGEVDEQFATIVAAVAIPLSLVSILFGFMIFQFITGTAASIASGVAVIYGLRSTDVSCDIITWTAPASAVVAFGVGVLIAKRAVCLLGAVFGGALPYLIFSLFPSLGILDTGNAPNAKLLGFFVLPVWVTIGCSAILFGIALCRFSNLVKMIVTAAIGAYGAVAAVCLFIDPPENWIFAVAVCGSFVVGVSVQYTVKMYRRRRGGSSTRGDAQRNRRRTRMFTEAEMRA